MRRQLGRVKFRGPDDDRDSDGLIKCEIHRDGPAALNISLQVNGLLTTTACIAGVLVSLPPFRDSSTCYVASRSLIGLKLKDFEVPQHLPVFVAEVVV